MIASMPSAAPAASRSTCTIPAPCDPCQVPSLQDICSDRIIHYLSGQNFSDAFDIYRYAKNYKLFRLYDFSRLHIRDRYAYYLEKYGDSLTALLEEDAVPMHQMHVDRLKAEAFLRRRGSVVEPVKVDVSVSEDGYYPLCALVSGVEWPPGVPPAKREQFLCPSEFESVFGMSKEAFNARDKFTKEALKKAKKLF